MEEAYRIAIEEFFKISLADLEFSILYLGKYSTILRTLGRVILIDPSDVINVHLLEEYNKVDYVFYSCRLSDSYNREVALEIYRTFKPIFSLIRQLIRIFFYIFRRISSKYASWLLQYSRSQD